MEDCAPISSKRPPPRLWNRKLGVVSLATNMSGSPSLSMSHRATPSDLPSAPAIPELTLISVNLPFPLFRKSVQCVGLKALGRQYERSRKFIRQGMSSLKLRY